MIDALSLYIFSTCIIHATACFSSPRRVFPSWASPTISREKEIIPSPSTTTATISDGNRKLTAPNFAFQEKILENFQLNWGNNAEIRKQNRREIDPSSSSEKQQPPQPSPQQRIPFIIENIGRGEKHEIEEIVRLCIDVFFNKQEHDDELELQEQVVFDARGNTRMKKRQQQKSIPPWKAMQLAYLRNFQTGEILARNAFNKEQYVNLIVARRVYAAPTRGRTNNIRRINLMDIDTNQIFNADLLSSLSSNINGGGTGAAGYELVAGEIIGYCEVSEKNFGLGGNYESTKPRRRSSSSASSKTTTTGASKNNKLRPYLSNLSVVDYARKSGVGSKLLNAGEDAVRNWDAGHTEIVLQVEEDNTNAIQFYKRRGWEFVFADPTCRRYDTSGFFLKECRITKYAMIKRLDNDAAGSSSATTSTANKSDEEESESATSFIEKIMSSFFPQ